MRISFVSQPGHAVLPAAGSIELWAATVAGRLADEHAVTIYASRPPSPPAAHDEAVTYRLVPHGAARPVVRAARYAWRLLPPTRPFYASVLHPLEYWLRVGREIGRQGADIVHVFNYSQALPILRRLTGAKLVLHMHCEWLSQLDRRMIDARLRHADLIIGCSEHITNLVRERFPQHADRCTTVYNGVGTGQRSVDRTPQRDVIELLNVGRVSPEKGLHVLIDALERLIPSHPQLRLTILGEESPVPLEFAVKIATDPLVKNLERFYGASYLHQLRDRMSAEVSKRVTFVDRVSHANALRYYQGADIFVYPSIFESFAIPPVEAMAAGVPVVASRVGGMQETIDHEHTGLLVGREDPVALAHAIERLVESPALRRSFGEAGAIRAEERFAWETITGCLESKYGSLLDRPATAEHRPTDLVGSG